MIIVLFVPHIFVISNFALLVQRQRDQTIHSDRFVQYYRCVLLSQFENDQIGLVLDHFRCQGPQRGKDLGKTIPLPYSVLVVREHIPLYRSTILRCSPAILYRVSQ